MDLNLGSTEDILNCDHSNEKLLGSAILGAACFAGKNISISVQAKILELFPDLIHAFLRAKRSAPCEQRLR